MPLVKPISGHTRLGAARRYLEREGRALARDFLNLDAPMAGIGEDGLPEYRKYDWASIMDETREKLGNDSPFKGRKARTYKHYVFSPDPRDAVSLSELRSVTMSWVEENFADFEVAVVYHDDNEHHVPHAHVIVNNTNLVTGRRLQDPDPRALKRSAQRIAREHGLSFYEDEPRDPETGVIPDSEAYARRNTHIVERDRVAHGEYSWVGDIRARVDVAKGIAKSPEDFRQALRDMGVNVRESASRKGDWVYSLAGTPSRQVTGSKLGVSYTRREVTVWLRSPTRRAPGPITVRNVREVATGAIEVKNHRELIAKQEQGPPLLADAHGRTDRAPVYLIDAPHAVLVAIVVEVLTRRHPVVPGPDPRLHVVQRQDKPRPAEIVLHMLRHPVLVQSIQAHVEKPLSPSGDKNDPTIRPRHNPA